MKRKHDGFINVDLEIIARSRMQLAPLIDAVDDKLFALYLGRARGRFLAAYESMGPSMTRRTNPTVVIHELADVIEALPRPARRAWDAAAKRDFNIGVELERGVWTVEHVVEPEAVARVAALGGRLVFTAYQLAALRRPKRRKRAA